MNRAWFFALLLVLLVLARLCHVGVLWPEETLPLAAAAHLREGRMLYRDIWFDKPPLVAVTCLVWGARTSVALRLAGALYALAACWLAWRFARDAWGEVEGRWAASLLAFFLTFDLHSAVLPLAADLLMLVPHLAAVYLAWRGRAFWSGAVAGVAFLTNAKGLFVLAACSLWVPRALPLLALGFAAPLTLTGAWLAMQDALVPCYEQVWKLGRMYAADTFVENPLRHGLARTLSWLGFHAALAVGALAFWLRGGEHPRSRWVAWAALSLAAAGLGWRFFPRYFFHLLPVATLAGARGLALLGHRRILALALLVLPLARFGPRYAMLARDLLAHRPHDWADVAMDRDSREAAVLVSHLAAPGDSLVVWGYRPELFVYTGLSAASRFLESQPLTGVIADRHLFQSRPTLPAAWTAAHLAELARSRPTFILDGLGPYNPSLAITSYPQLRDWLGPYIEVARSRGTVIYRRRGP